MRRSRKVEDRTPSALVEPMGRLRSKKAEGANGAAMLFWQNFLE
jgi:hypothetical protein